LPTKPAGKLASGPPANSLRNHSAQQFGREGAPRALLKWRRHLGRPQASQRVGVGGRWALWSSASWRSVILLAANANANANAAKTSCAQRADNKQCVRAGLCLRLARHGPPSAARSKRPSEKE